MKANFERLERMVDMLNKLKVPQRQFRMETFGAPNIPTPWQLLESLWKDNHCGTAACAMGWATELGTFKQEGLKWAGGLIAGIPCYKDPKYGEVHGFSAAAFLFEIPLNVADELFSGSWEGATPKEVAANIQMWMDRQPEYVEYKARMANPAMCEDTLRVMEGT